jgi:hypothetical protein
LRVLTRLVIASQLALVALAAGGSPSHAFWKRSHWDACNDAPNEAERIRLQCWIFEPVDQFPPLGVIGIEGRYGGPPWRAHRPKSRIGGPVVQRLG